MGSASVSLDIRRGSERPARPFETQPYRNRPRDDPIGITETRPQSRDEEEEEEDVMRISDETQSNDAQKHAVQTSDFLEALTIKTAERELTASSSSSSGSK
ncbi:hypothetical protein M9458_014584, partial [Cirrhinus mrigala]